MKERNNKDFRQSNLHISQMNKRYSSVPLSLLPYMWERFCYFIEQTQRDIKLVNRNYIVTTFINLHFSNFLFHFYLFSISTAWYTSLGRKARDTMHIQTGMTSEITKNYKEVCLAWNKKRKKSLDNLQASFLVAEKELHADSWPWKQENLLCQHIAWVSTAKDSQH